LAHSEHNRSRRNSGWFAMIILGALMLFVAPNIYPVTPELGVAALAGGLIIGGLGFFLRFVRGRHNNV